MRKPPTEAEIITTLRAKAERDGTDKLFAKDVVSDPECISAHYIKKRYKRVNDAIRAAGLYPGQPNKEDLKRDLREFYAKYGRAPRVADAYEGRLHYSFTSFATQFVTWNNGLRSVNLDTIMWSQDYTEEVYAQRAEELAQEIVGLYGESGILPSPSEHNRRVNAMIEADKKPPHRAAVYKRYLGPLWVNVAKATHLQLASGR